MEEELLPHVCFSDEGSKAAFGDGKTLLEG